MTKTPRTAPKHRCYHCQQVFKTTVEDKSMPCPKCGEYIHTKMTRIHYFSQNQRLRDLTEGPNADPNSGNIHYRTHSQRLKAPTRGTGDYKNRDTKLNTKTIVYMVGDERRAVDKFIEENTDFVAEILEERESNLFSRQWDDFLYQILLEQWYIKWKGGYADDRNQGNSDT